LWYLFAGENMTVKVSLLDHIGRLEAHRL